MNNDLISREALRKDIEHLHNVYAENKDYFYTDVLDHIDNAPTVDLWEMRQEATENALKKAEVLYKRPQGEWIEENSETGALGIKYTWVKCNQCGWSNSLVIPKNFCPNCGAYMRGTTNENSN